MPAAKATQSSVATTAPAPQASAATPWRVQLLGRPCLQRELPAAQVWLTPKDAALLAVVALDGPIAAAHVAALIWPEAKAKRADTSLRQRLFRLRRDHDAHVVSAGALLQLSPGVQTDIAASLAAMAMDPEAGRDALLGDLNFDTLPELADWLRGARERWQAQRDAALAAAAALCEASGAVARGLAYAQRLAVSEPLSEHAQRRLMRLHYLRGDASAAIAVFERFEARLKDELGARPGAETIELLTTIERGAVTLPLPTQRAVAPASLMRPPRLVGRAVETAALAQAWSSQRVFALHGEAGIGKTRLLGDVAAASEGVLSVQARPGDASITYALLARLLRALLARFNPPLDAARRQQLALVLPELGQAVALAGDAQRLLLQRAVEATLAQALALGLQALILDDLHFADDASVECLQALTLSDDLSALRWGFALRAAEAGAAAMALQRALEDTQRLETVRLAPLNLAQMAELIASLALPGLDAPALAAALLKHSGGNPMFALETLKDMVLAGGHGGHRGAGKASRLPQPSTVAALVQRRLAQLSAPALKLARVAALAGASFSAELAATVLSLHPLDLAEPWHELDVAQVFCDHAFAHDLIFEATRDSVPTPIARLLHRHIAEVLLTQQAAPASLAVHWAGAHEWARAGEAHVEAARQAQSASQRSHEVEHWRQARDCFDKAGDTGRAFDARCDSIQSLIVVQGVAHADSVIDGLIQDARGDAQQAAALTARAMAALMSADHERGVAAATQAATIARRLASPWPHFEAARLHAAGLAQAGRAVEGLAEIEPLRELVEREGNPEQRGRFWADYAYVLNSARRLRDSAKAMRRAIDNAQALGDLAELATLTSNLATIQGNLGHVDEALVLTQRAFALQAELGATDGPTGGVVQTYLGHYCGRSGAYDEALEHLGAAIERFRRDGQTLWIAVASNHLALLWIELGQFARARQTLNYETPPVVATQARRAVLSARLDRALALHSQHPSQHHPQPPATDALALLGPAGDGYTRWLALLDETDKLDAMAAVTRCDEVLRMAADLEYMAVAMRAELLRAFALHRAGRSAQAATALRRLLPKLADVQPADMYLPDAWWGAVQVFRACEAVDDAAMALAQGLAWVHQRALPHVPAAFRESFLQRNPTNLALLSVANRR